MNDLAKNRKTRLDTRVLEHRRYVKPEDIDRFKDEVQVRYYASTLISY